MASKSSQSGAPGSMERRSTPLFLGQSTCGNNGSLPRFHALSGKSSITFSQWMTPSPSSVFPSPHAVCATATIVKNPWFTFYLKERWEAASGAGWGCGSTSPGFTEQKGWLMGG
ncbi:hypothetical protein QQ045_017851 [Rhodiola kirilowii]